MSNVCEEFKFYSLFFFSKPSKKFPFPRIFSGCFPEITYLQLLVARAKIKIFE